MDANQLSSRMVKRLGLLGKAVELRRNWTKAIAFCSITNKRLNQLSSSTLPIDVIRNIVGMLFSNSEALEEADHGEYSSEDEGEDSEEGEEPNLTVINNNPA
jgi:hypothetical protein